MINIEEAMGAVSGTVFVYYVLRDEKSVSLFTDAAERTGRRVFRREDCQNLDPAVLARSSDRKMIFVAPAMMDFLDRYLEARPTDHRHSLIHAREVQEAIRSMSFVFHDFWEERHVSIEDFCPECGPQAGQGDN